MDIAALIEKQARVVEALQDEQLNLKQYGGHTRDLATAGAMAIDKLSSLLQSEQYIKGFKD